MGISPIELQGNIQRMQDFSTIKQNEDNKSVVDQSNFQTHFQRETNEKREQVNRGENTGRQDKKYDASEKGSNEYQGNEQHAKKDKEKTAGQVVLKNMSRGGFDVKI